MPLIFCLFDGQYGINMVESTKIWQLSQYLTIAILYLLKYVIYYGKITTCFLLLYIENVEI